MILSVLIILAIVAFILTIANAMYPPRVPLWIAVLILSVMALLQVLPLK